MAALRKKIPAIDFRPRRQKRFRFLAVALLLLSGIGWFGWQWISPYDRAFVIEKQLATLQDEELKETLASLPALEAPGYRVLFGALGNPQHEVRRAARTSVSEMLDRWQREPKQQPKILAALTIMLAERASSFPNDARQESQDLFRRWVNLASPEKVSANLAQREFHARRQLLDWVMEPRLAQPPRLRAQERAERTAMLQNLVASASSGAGQGADDSATNYAVAAGAATPPKNETKFQVVAVDHDPDNGPKAIANFDQGPPIPGGSANQAAQLSGGPNTEAHPVTPLNEATFKRLSATSETPEAVRRAAAHVMTSADLLSTDAPARYRLATPAVRRQLLVEFQAAGIAAADLTLLELYASATPAALAEPINGLPQRTDVEGQLWLRQYAVHPDSTVRRMAWSWLITSSDRSTKQWLAERAATDSDSDLRQWYQAMTKQRKVR
jgi:hypothetical protein